MVSVKKINVESPYIVYLGDPIDYVHQHLQKVKYNAIYQPFNVLHTQQLHQELKATLQQMCNYIEHVLEGHYKFVIFDMIEFPCQYTLRMLFASGETVSHDFYFNVRTTLEEVQQIQLLLTGNHDHSSYMQVFNQWIDTLGDYYSDILNDKLIQLQQKYGTN